MPRRLLLFPALAFISLATSGCFLSDSCREATVAYDGTRSGQLIQILRTPSGDFGGAEFDGVMQGPFDTGKSQGGGFSGSAACSSPLDSEEAGWKARAWIDLDGDDVAICQQDPSSPDCAPDPNDPAGETDFTLAARGLTTYRIEIRDP